jgi:predicted RNA-binding Zn-ribbon protein involved in translation (DUF1610 family)
MILKPKETRIAYFCPECASATLGIIGKFALNSNMVRLKCKCGKSSLDISVTNDAKIRLSIPCIFCKQNHSYVVSQSIFFERDIFILNCPYANMDIGFIGSEKKTTAEINRATSNLEKLIRSLELESYEDVQPSTPSDDDFVPDASLYDTLRFIVKDLEAEGNLHCPCKTGPYDLRFTENGVEAYCENCGAKYIFPVKSASLAEDYLTVSELTLSQD